MCHAGEYCTASSITPFVVVVEGVGGCALEHYYGNCSPSADMEARLTQDDANCVKGPEGVKLHIVSFYVVVYVFLTYRILMLNLQAFFSYCVSQYTTLEFTLSLHNITAVQMMASC